MHDAVNVSDSWSIAGGMDSEELRRGGPGYGSDGVRG